jgi:hypothetical protein
MQRRLRPTGASCWKILEIRRLAVPKGAANFHCQERHPFNCQEQHPFNEKMKK